MTRKKPIQTVETIEPVETVMVIPMPSVESEASLTVAVQNDPIEALVSIQTRGDKIETIAIRELVASVVGVPESNIEEMVKTYKEKAGAAGWAASTLKVRASNLKGVLECARLNSGFADLIGLQSSCGLQRAYAMRAEFLKGIEGAAEKEDNEPVEEESITVGLTATGAYVQALARAIVCAELADRVEDIDVLRGLMTQASVQS